MHISRVRSNQGKRLLCYVVCVYAALIATNCHISLNTCRYLRAPHSLPLPLPPPPPPLPPSTRRKFECWSLAWWQFVRTWPVLHVPTRMPSSLLVHMWCFPNIFIWIRGRKLLLLFCRGNAGCLHSPYCLAKSVMLPKCSIDSVLLT